MNTFHCPLQPIQEEHRLLSGFGYRFMPSHQMQIQIEYQCVSAKRSACRFLNFGGGPSAPSWRRQCLYRHIRRSFDAASAGLNSVAPRCISEKRLYP
jgi:hypothetical protein